VTLVVAGRENDADLAQEGRNVLAERLERHGLSQKGGEPDPAVQPLEVAPLVVPAQHPPICPWWLPLDDEAEPRVVRPQELEDVQGAI
jgi:hypothetical protein